MEEESLSYQLHSSRIADFILCSHQPFVRFSSMSDCLPAAEDREAFLAALKRDPLDRFCYIDEGDETLVGLKTITEEDSRIQADVEWWRTSIGQYLERVCTSVELGRIASLVERPIDVPRNIRLKDIINSDYTKRFCIHGAPDRLMLSKRISPDEIEENKDTWRKRIHDFLYIQSKDTTLTSLGSSVTRPTNLGGSRTKLIELLQTDPEERFHLIYRSPTETVVRVKLSDSQRDWLHEKWRIKAVGCLVEQQRTMSLTELGASVKRPSVHLGSTSSLRCVLTEDPQSRFILSGQGDCIRVRLSADAELPPRRPRPSSSTAPSSSVGGGDPLEWSKVSRRPVRTTTVTTTSATTATYGKSSKIRHRQTTEAELSELSSRQGRWNANTYAKDKGKNKDKEVITVSSDSHSEHSHSQSQSHFLNLVAMASPVITELSTESTSAAADSPQGAFSSHSSSWEWRNPLDDLSVRASLFAGSASGAGADTAMQSFVQQTGVPASFGSGPVRRPSYKDKLLPPAAPVDAQAGRQKAICRPTTTAGTKGSALSPYAPEYTPGAGVVAKEDTDGQSQSQSQSHRRIEEWLPTVLLGFDAPLILTFVARLQAEGFLCVRDLVMARSLGQLTTEYLSAMGFKVGHCNRIFASLPMPSSSA